jgi:pimeloyl-ACP methyl ester carboxylesterase
MDVDSIPIRGGTIEAFRLPGGPGTPLLVLGGVETGLRRLAGTEHLLSRRWAGRAEHRAVVVVGRPLPTTDDETDRLMHPRVIADAVATAIGWIAANGGPEPPYAVEAESGGGRITLWLAVDHPELVSRLVLSSVASETKLDSAMARRMEQWIDLAEHDDWGMFFGHMAVQMKPADASGSAPAFDAAARLQPRPATPERFVGELRATLDPSSFVTDHLREIHVPALVLAGGRDQVVPPDATRQVADGLPDARFALDAECGHTVRTSFNGYHRMVEEFLAQGDPGAG